MFVTVAFDHTVACLVADMVADIKVDKVANMVADMEMDKKVNMAVDEVVNKVADMGAEIETAKD